MIYQHPSTAKWNHPVSSRRMWLGSKQHPLGSELLRCDRECTKLRRRSYLFNRRRIASGSKWRAFEKLFSGVVQCVPGSRQASLGSASSLWQIYSSPTAHGSHESGGFYQSLADSPLLVGVSFDEPPRLEAFISRFVISSSNLLSLAEALGMALCNGETIDDDATVGWAFVGEEPGLPPF